MVATFCVGLRNNSRVYKEITGGNVLNTDTLLALLIDDVRNLMFALAGKENKEISVVELMLNKSTKQKQTGFISIDEFEKKRKSFIRKEE